MNSVLNDPGLPEALWKWEKRIGVIVAKRGHHWIVAPTGDFILDGDKLEQAYRKQGIFSDKVLAETKKLFRGGISQLTEEILDAFLALPSTGITRPADLRDFLYADVRPEEFPSFVKQLENHLAYGDAIDANGLLMRRRLASKLPTFYINFDRKIYMHMDWDRSHEDLAYSGWRSRCADFGSSIPVEERYWWNAAFDLWPVKFFTD